MDIKECFVEFGKLSLEKKNGYAMAGVLERGEKNLIGKLLTLVDATIDTDKRKAYKDMVKQIVWFVFADIHDSLGSSVTNSEKFVEKEGYTAVTRFKETLEGAH